MLCITELAENGERVKSQEKEIEKLHGDIDDSKEEVHYLRNKLEHKRDIIDDLEHEIEQKDGEYKKIKKDH
jgi:septal ring factor EnvC (AmiA/AmiB activator)